jgi:mono/diheme cytochrome c family protein
MSRLTRLATLAGIGLILTAFATTAAAQTKVKTEPIKAVADVSGSSTFQAYCTTCHGIGGHGNGPAAAALKVAPPDLTLISQRAGGKFPSAKVKAQITGNDVIAAHGSRDMPTWGPLFKAVDTSDSVAELRLTNLIKYIDNIKAK